MDYFFPGTQREKRSRSQAREIQRVLFRLEGGPVFNYLEREKKGREKKRRERKNRLYRAVERVIFPRALAIRARARERKGAFRRSAF